MEVKKLFFVFSKKRYQVFVFSVIISEELYQRINLRVDIMMEEGLLKEALSLYPHKDLPALQTVGYKELFSFFDLGLDENDPMYGVKLSEAVELIKRNTRHYAKRQMTWWGRDKSINWISLK